MINIAHLTMGKLNYEKHNNYVNLINEGFLYINLRVAFPSTSIYV